MENKKITDLNDKELIKCTDIVYDIEKNIRLKPNGYITYNDFIVYNKKILFFV